MDMQKFGYTEDIYGNPMMDKALYDYFSHDAVSRILCRDSVNLLAKTGQKFPMSKKCKFSDFRVDVGIGDMAQVNACSVAFVVRRYPGLRPNGRYHTHLLEDAQERFEWFLINTDMVFKKELKIQDQHIMYEFTIARKVKHVSI